MNFNTHPQIFSNLAKSILATDPPLRTACRIKDGHVIYMGDVIARFDDSDKAMKTLMDAGFAQLTRNGETIYLPL